MKIIDPSQFGGTPRSSATHTLFSMVRSWAEATDGPGSAVRVRVALFDYRKAFDLIDHHILAKKVSLFSMPLFVKRWVIDFLMKRQQRVKLTRDYLSEWADILSGVPQGIKVLLYWVLRAQLLIEILFIQLTRSFQLWRVQVFFNKSRAQHTGIENSS